MSFLNPLFLFGLAAAAIPILIHLFTRRRPREVRFSSLEFLSEVNQSEIRRLRIKQWLLLLLRTLAVIAIALAMARPALRGTAGLAGTGSTSVIVLVDRSGSMAANGVAGPLMQQARRTIEDLLATLGPTDDVLLVPYDRAPHPLGEQATGDLARVRAATQALAAGADVTDHGAALGAAARALAQSRALNREVFWISDFQSVGFAGAGAASGAGFTAPEGPWDRARVYLVPLEPASRANAALSEAVLSPAEDAIALSVGAASFGAPAGDLAVEVTDASGRPLGRGFVPLPERGEASALVPLDRMPEDGGMVAIPADALPLDDRRVFAAGRAGMLRVLLREDGGPSPLRLALEAGSPASGLAVDVAAAGSLGPALGAADVLVIHDVPALAPGELQAVLDWHRAGGALLLVLGPRSDAAFWNGSLLREANLGTLGGAENAGPGAAWRLERSSAGHPALAGFPARPGEPISTARFHSIRAYTPGREARAVLEFARGRPALVEAPHTLVFAAGLDAGVSDFPMSGAFLPLLHQAVKVLGRGSAAASLAPGDVFSMPAGTGPWRIEDESGREVASELVAAGGTTRLRSAPLEQPGLYRVRLGGELRTTFAVNPDLRESDLTALAPATLVRGFPAGRASVLRAGADLARRVREARFGRELWGPFVLIALLLLIAESVIGRMGTSPTAARSEKAA